MSDNRRRTYCCVFGCLNNSSIPELSLFRLPIEQESYVNYSNIAAEVLRKSLKADQKELAMKRGKSTIRYHYWVKGAMLPKGEKPKELEKDKA